MKIPIIVGLAVTCAALGLWGYRDQREAAFADAQLRETSRHLMAVEQAGVSEAGCRDRGGEIARRHFGGTFCKITYRDAGRACTDMKDCLGGCILPNAGNYPNNAAGLRGVCKTANVEGGCTSYLLGGRVGWSECID